MNKKVDNIILTAIALLFIFIQYGLKNKEIKIVDTTLRDGEQTAGVAFANHDKKSLL